MYHPVHPVICPQAGRQEEHSYAYRLVVKGENAMIEAMIVGTAWTLISLFAGVLYGMHAVWIKVNQVHCLASFCIGRGLR
ncbi:hypothetical protein [Sporolactobacillus sp. THM19-2]|jgi:hypothetical protein|nr:hypothetical protein [Sporolactobacillus sp. THM19-2]RYL93328.1 hypothetical protein EWH91_05670 [Sporolactobacillus sp. THM19-2]